MLPAPARAAAAPGPAASPFTQRGCSGGDLEAHHRWNSDTERERFFQEFTRICGHLPYSLKPSRKPSTHTVRVSPVYGRRQTAPLKNARPRPGPGRRREQRPAWRGSSPGARSIPAAREGRGRVHLATKAKPAGGRPGAEVPAPREGAYGVRAGSPPERDELRTPAGEKRPDRCSHCPAGGRGGRPGARGPRRRWRRRGWVGGWGGRGGPPPPVSPTPFIWPLRRLRQPDLQR